MTYVRGGNVREGTTISKRIVDFFMLLLNLVKYFFLSLVDPNFKAPKSNRPPVVLPNSSPSNSGSGGNGGTRRRFGANVRSLPSQDCSSGS